MSESSDLSKEAERESSTRTHFRVQGPACRQFEDWLLVEEDYEHERPGYTYGEVGTR